VTESDQPTPLTVDRTTVILDILEACPDAAELLAARFGGDCASCVAAETETLDVAARMHGLDIDALIGDVQKAVLERGGAPTASEGEQTTDHPATEPGTGKGATMEEKVREALEEIRPHLQADGGDVELVAVEEGEVRVRLKGACSGCPMAQMTLKQGIERTLKEKVPGVTAVTAVR
jgi:Fe-S cluster biogenesis protein NfuA